MELNYVLVWFVCVSCTVSLLRIIRSSAASRTWGWITILTIILITTVTLNFAAPSYSGYTGGILLGLFVLAPSSAARYMQKQVVRQQFTNARRLADVVRWLHPADGWREFPDILHALELAQNGDLSGASQVLQRHQNSQSTIGRSALSQLYRMNNRWQELADWIETTMKDRELRLSPEMLIHYMRALGETGNLNRLLLTYERFKKGMVSYPQQIWRDLFFLQVFAFAGKKDLVERLLQRGPLAQYPPSVSHFWLATADLANGNADAAKYHLQQMENVNDFWSRLGMERRKTVPVANAAEAFTLTPQTRSVLATAEKDFYQEERYGRHVELSRSVGYATYALIIANVIFFVFEMINGGSENTRTLVQLGALIPELAVQQHQWWRVLSAMFLHFGPLHIALNMFALYILGPYVEVSLGKVRYLITYFASGIGSMLFVVFLLLDRGSHSEMIVGASGAIMGLIGATAAVLLRGWRTDGAPAAKRRLVSIGAIILFQIMFDIYTPQVSSAAHLSGAVIGFAVASFLRISTTVS